MSKKNNQNNQNIEAQIEEQVTTEVVVDEVEGVECDVIDDEEVEEESKLKKFLGKHKKKIGLGLGILGGGIILGKVILGKRDKDYDDNMQDLDSYDLLNRDEDDENDKNVN